MIDKLVAVVVLHFWQMTKDFLHLQIYFMPAIFLIILSKNRLELLNTNISNFLNFCACKEQVYFDFFNKSAIIYDI
jgi:hypothetical protein